MFSLQYLLHTNIHLPNIPSSTVRLIINHSQRVCQLKDSSISFHEDEISQKNQVFRIVSKERSTSPHMFLRILDIYFLHNTIFDAITFIPKILRMSQLDIQIYIHVFIQQFHAELVFLKQNRWSSGCSACNVFKNKMPSIFGFPNTC